MTNFVKFSEVKKKRNAINQLTNDSMADVTGGAIAIGNPIARCTADPRKCSYLVVKYAVCPYNYACPIVERYGVPVIEEPIAAIVSER